MRQRALAKVPPDRIRLHRVTSRMIAVAEAEAEVRRDSTTWVALVLDLRDIRSEIEARYPVLAKKEARSCP